MADFPEFIIFALICALFATLAVLGGVAFRRTSRLRDALALAEERIRYLEEMLHDLAGIGTRGASRSTPAPVYDLAASRAPASIVAPTTPVTQQAAASGADEPRRSPFANIEKVIAGNWLVWIGGACIAIAIISILRFAIDSGWFGPPMQLAAAYVLGVMLYSAAEIQRRKPDTDASTQMRHLPAILAAASLFAIFTATYAGHATFGLLPTGLTFVIFALCALAAIILALRYGPWLAVLGLGGGYLAPALVRFENPSPAALFGYVLALTAATLAIIKFRRWRGFVWLVAGGALGWGVLWLFTAGPNDDFGAAAFYITAIAALGIVFAWNEIQPLPDLADVRAGRLGWNEPVVAAHALIAASALVLLLMSVASGSLLVLAAMIALCALTTITATRRDGLSLAPFAAAFVGVAAMLFWRASHGDAPANNLIYFAGALGFVFSGGGWLMMAHSRHHPGYGATLAALGPISVVAATREAAPFLNQSWVFAALMLAVLNGVAAYQLSRGAPMEERGRGPIAAFILGAATALAFAVCFALDRFGLWLSGALALLAPLYAYLDLRLRAPSFRVAISGIAAIVSLGLIFGFEPLRQPVGATPLLNALVPGFAVPALCFWGAGWLYRRAGLRATSRLVELLEITALIVAVAGLSWEARHLANGGNLRAASVSLLEAGTHATGWLALALGLAARFGPRPRRVVFFTEAILVVAAVVWLFLTCVFALNPWWGERPAAITGWPIFNPLLVAYGAPAALLAAYAILKRRQGLARRAAAAGVAATALAFVNVTLEVRRTFQGPDMAGGAILSLEAWAYTAVWVVFAGALLALGLVRRKPSLRYASLAVLLAAIIKAFGFDMSALTGVLRALSYLGLGVAVIGVALVYQRYVFPRALKSSAPT